LSGHKASLATRASLPGYRQGHGGEKNKKDAMEKDRTTKVWSYETGDDRLADGDHRREKNTRRATYEKPKKKESEGKKCQKPPKKFECEERHVQNSIQNGKQSPRKINHLDAGYIKTKEEKKKR